MFTHKGSWADHGLRWVNTAIWILILCLGCSRDNNRTERLPEQPRNQAETVLKAIQPDGSMLLIPSEALKSKPTTKVGDLLLVPLYEFCSECENQSIELTAADSFVKKISGSEAKQAYLDPHTMRAFLLRENDKPFTIRDIVQVAFLNSVADGKLAVLRDGKSIELDIGDLKAKSTGDKLDFPRLLEFSGISRDGLSTVSLVAADDYRKEVNLDQFLSGSLYFEGMRCEFPGLSSKYQIRNLTRIELQ